MQLRIFKALSDKYDDLSFNIMGSCRNSDDRDILTDLNLLRDKLKLEVLTINLLVYISRIKFTFI